MDRSGRRGGSCTVLDVGRSDGSGANLGRRTQGHSHRPTHPSGFLGLIEITGGLFTNDGKPFATIAVPAGLTAPPDSVTRTVEWTRTFGGAAGGEVMYQITETFTFALNADGVCCTVAYEGEGSTTTDDGKTTVSKAAGVLGDYVGVGARRDTAFGTTFDDKWGLPFQETQMLQPGTDEPFCRRPVAQPPGFSSNGVWEVYETDGAAVDGGEPVFGMYTQCDISGFDAATAQSFLPQVPAATAPERAARQSLADTGGCPVFQESFNALYSPSMGSAPTDDLQRMFMRPNSAACSAFVTIGEEGRGGVRSVMQYDLSTEDPRVEAIRLYDAVEDQYTSLPAHEIPRDGRCEIGDDGVALAPLFEDEPCLLRTFHKLGEGEITIWTDWDTSDGPNVIVRGAFPWGHYFYTCHHCDPFSPEVPRIIAAMHKFGNTGIGNFGPNAQVIGSVGAPEGRVGETSDVFDVDQDLVYLFAEDSSDPIERAAIAAALGLIASGAMVGLGLAENRLDRKDEPLIVEDEHGNHLEPNEDGLYPWEVDGETRHVDRDELVRLIAEARWWKEYNEADAEKRVRMQQARSDLDLDELDAKTSAEAKDFAATQEANKGRRETIAAWFDKHPEYGHLWERSIRPDGSVDLELMRQIMGHQQRAAMPDPDDPFWLMDGLESTMKEVFTGQEADGSTYPLPKEGRSPFPEDLLPG